MMVITMLSALVGDMILLPSLMQHVELVTIWDLLRLKMGKAPELGIPLFRGLNRTQLHYILMAGTLRKSEAGEILFRKGEPSDSMYAVISGGMDVVDHPEEEDPSETHGIQKLISRIAPGDLVGEMGLLRSAPRSATVIVTQPSELLQINWKMLKRLQWLYPPAAHKLFYNLMSFLCDRLQQTTECLSQSSHVDDLTGFFDRDDFLKFWKSKPTGRAVTVRTCPSASCGSSSGPRTCVPMSASRINCSDYSEKPFSAKSGNATPWAASTPAPSLSSFPRPR